MSSSGITNLTNAYRQGAHTLVTSRTEMEDLNLTQKEGSYYEASEQDKTYEQQNDRNSLVQFDSDHTSSYKSLVSFSSFKGFK